MLVYSQIYFQKQSALRLGLMVKSIILEAESKEGPKCYEYHSHPSTHIHYQYPNIYNTIGGLA